MSYINHLMGQDKEHINLIKEYSEKRGITRVADLLSVSPKELVK